MHWSLWPSLPNYLIAFTFLWVAGWVGWVYRHRHGDWPKSWALGLIGACIFWCGMSRYFHAVGDHESLVTLFDWLSAVTGVVASVFVPIASRAIVRFPTPAEVEHAIRGNMQKRSALAAAEEAVKKKEAVVRQRDLLLAVIRQSPALPDDLKGKVNELIEELEKSSNAPNDTRPLHDSGRGSGTHGSEPMESGRRPLG